MTQPVWCSPSLPSSKVLLAYSHKELMALALWHPTRAHSTLVINVRCRSIADHGRHDRTQGAGSMSLARSHLSYGASGTIGNVRFASVGLVVYSCRANAVSCQQVKPLAPGRYCVCPGGCHYLTSRLRVNWLLCCKNIILNSLLTDVFERDQRDQMTSFCLFVLLHLRQGKWFFDFCFIWIESWLIFYNIVTK